MTVESRSMTSKSISEHQISIIHAVCHVMGMVSACANPIIYGFFNENFHREFSILYNVAKKGLCCLCTKISSNTLVVSPGANGQDPLGNGRNGKNCSCDFRFKEFCLQNQLTCSYLTQFWKWYFVTKIVLTYC